MTSRDRRAAGDVHHRLVLDDLGDAHRAGRIRAGGLDAAPVGAGPDGHHGGRTLGGLLQQVLGGPATDGAVDPALIHGDRPGHQQDVLPGVGLHRVLHGRLDSRAGAGHEGVLVVQRDQVEDQVADRGVGRSGARSRRSRCTPAAAARSRAGAGAPAGRASSSGRGPSRPRERHRGCRSTPGNRGGKRRGARGCRSDSRPGATGTGWAGIAFGTSGPAGAGTSGPIDHGVGARGRGRREIPDVPASGSGRESPAYSAQANEGNLKAR